MTDPTPEDLARDAASDLQVAGLDLMLDNAAHYGRHVMPSWIRRAAAAEARVRLLEEAVRRAVQFIENGVEYGYIRMPSAPDPALKTLPDLKAALAGGATPEDGR